MIDAAGNETRGAVEPLLVSNHPPAPPIAAAVTNAPTGWINHPAAIAWRNPAPASGLPIAGVAWVACRGVDTTIPAAGCGAAHSQATPLTSLDEDLTTEPAFAGRLPDRYTVFIWLVDSSGAFDPAAPARVGFGFDDTAPGPPAALRATANSTGTSFAFRATPPPHVAPIASIHWTACKIGGRCTLTRTAPGLTFDFAPATDPAFRPAPRGTFSVRAWLQDAAGNHNPNATTTVTVTSASSLAPKPRRKPSPRLRVNGVAIHGRQVLVTGSTSRLLSGRVRVVLHATLGSVDHVLRHTVPATAGHFSTSFVRPVAAHLARVTVTFAGDRKFRSQTVTTTIAKP